jgi:hypothetical protein
MTVRPDRFDEMRRAWIAAHQGTSTIQRRRAEVLGRDVRSRQRAVANAVPDPHDDTVLPPLWLRNAHSPAAQLELMGVLALTLLAAVGLACRLAGAETGEARGEGSGRRSQAQRAARTAGRSVVGTADPPHST